MRVPERSAFFAEAGRSPVKADASTSSSFARPDRRGRLSLGEFSGACPYANTKSPEVMLLSFISASSSR